MLKKHFVILISLIYLLLRLPSMSQKHFVIQGYYVEENRIFVLLLHSQSPTFGLYSSRHFHKKKDRHSFHVVFICDTN
jgi:hypothetical protein